MHLSQLVDRMNGAGVCQLVDRLHDADVRQLVDRLHGTGVPQLVDRLHSAPASAGGQASWRRCAERRGPDLSWDVLVP